MRAAGYARYSTDRQTENSIEFQVEKIQEYCKQHQIPLVAVYADEALSGMHVEKRGNLHALLQAAERQEFDTVIIYDQSRLSRNISDWFELRERLRQLNITLISATQTLKSPDDPEGFLAEGMTAILNHHFVLQSRQKTIAGQTTKAKKGLFLGGVAPLGYDISEGEYVINPVESDAVKLIFSMYADGRSYNQIIDALKARNMNIGKRGRPIGKTALHEILQNERYIGVYTWNRRRVKQMGQWAGGGPNPNAVRIEGRIPPIIDIEIWERVRNRMKDRKRNPASGKREYLLTGLLKCAKCGGSFGGHTSKNTKGYEYEFYCCATKYRTKECDCKNIAVNDLDPFIIYLLRDRILNESSIEEIADIIVFDAERSMINVQRIKSELAQIETEEQRIIDAVCKGAPWDLFAEKSKTLITKKAALSAKLKAAKGQGINREKIIANLKIDIEGFVPEAKISAKREIISKYIKEIRLDDETIEIVPRQVLPIDGCGGRI